MFYKFIIYIILCFLVVFVHGEKLLQPGPPDFCFKTKSYHINDRYHKDVPSPQGSDFPECQSWKESSCCTHALVEQLSRKKTLGLYNVSHELCGSISSRCAEYIRNEDCFYWCEPMLGYFFQPAIDDVHNVPVCMDYCDAWFEACRDDYTCFDNWLESYGAASTLTNCSAPYTCRTFGEIFKDGKGLCNGLWGGGYVYSTDMDNCTVLAFNSSLPNPNFKLTFPRSGSLSGRVLGSIVIYLPALLTFVLVAADTF